MTSRGLLESPIDQFGRYAAVAAIITDIAKQKQQTHITVLDIGGYKGQTARFFTGVKAKVTVLDLPKSSEPGYVQGSALALPFPNKSFDYVVSFEVMEHIARQDREQYLREALRVSNGTFIFTAPFTGDTQEVAQAEVQVNNVWRSIYGTDHKWLAEHLENGIPTEQEVEAMLAKQKLPFKKIGNNNLVLWSLMLSFAFVTTLFRPSGANPAIERFFNENASTLESANEANYRQIYIVGEDSQRQLTALAAPKVSAADRVKKQTELVTKLFTTLAKDITGLQTALHAKERALQELVQKLEARIKAHDALVVEIARLSAELQILRTPAPPAQPTEPTKESKEG